MSLLDLLRSCLSGIAAAFLHLHETLSSLNFPTLEKLWAEEFSCKMAGLRVPAMDENARKCLRIHVLLVLQAVILRNAFSIIHLYD